MSTQLMRHRISAGSNAGIAPLATPVVHRVIHSVHQSRLSRLALATSLAAACIHYTNKPCSTSHYTPSTIGVTFDRRGTKTGHSLISFATTTTTTSSSRDAAPTLRRSSARLFSTESIVKGATETAPPPQSPAPRNARLDDAAAVHSEPSQARELSDLNDIGELMRHPALLKNIKKPRYPIVLCHGLYGFDVRGPFWGLEIHYWASVLDILREKVGAEVIVRGVPGTGAIADRAEKLHTYLASDESGVKGKPINFVAHSMGGLDARHIISVIKPSPEDYKPVSLTTICTPHKGSPFMDWCNANVGTGTDRVQAEIREAKKKMGKEQATTQELQEATRAAEEEERKKLPFSLKTPLFVRPSKGERQEEEAQQSQDKGKGKEEGVVDTVKAALTTVAATATSFTPVPPLSSEGSVSPSSSDSASAPATLPKEGNKEKSSSLLNFSSFNKALSNIGGLFSSYMLGVLDQPAYAMLSTRYMSQVFNPSVPDSPDVAYFSIASRKRSLPIWHPLWLPKLVLDAAAESRSAGGETDGSGDALGGELQGNDGLVSVESAKWGNFLGIIEGCDHWDLRGGGAPRWRGRMNPATNKPWPEDKDARKEEEEKKKNKGWMDVNTIVGKLLNRKDDGSVATTSESKDKAAKKSVEEEQRDEGLLDEVAGWISSRLPQGDEKRRAEADKVAEKQDRTAQAPVRDEGSAEAKDNDKGEGVVEGEGDKQQQAASFDVSTTSVKLRREAAWQEEIGHTDAARELRRELAWHRANWDGKSVERKGDPKTKNDKPSRNSDWGERPPKRIPEGKEKIEDVNELERFWIALCRHLWNHGY